MAAVFAVTSWSQPLVVIYDLETMAGLPPPLPPGTPDGCGVVYAPPPSNPTAAPVWQTLCPGVLV